MTTYIISCLVWFVAGVGAGLVIGLYVRDVNANGRTTVSTATDPATAATPAIRRRRYKPTSTQVLGMVVVLMALMSTVLVGAQNTCQTRYFTAYTETLKSRDAIATKSRQDSASLALSNKQMWLSLIDQSPTDPNQRPTQAQRDAALVTLRAFFADVDEFVASVEAVNSARLVYPIPANECPVLGWLQ